MIRVSGLDHVAIPVSDVESSLLWYRRLFGLVHTFAPEWGTDPAFLCIGGTCLALLDAKGAVPPSVEPSIQHFCFRTDENSFVSATETLKAEGIPYRCDDHGVAHSLYFQDPDGHWIEITSYRPGREP